MTWISKRSNWLYSRGISSKIIRPIPAVRVVSSVALQEPTQSMLC